METEDMVFDAFLVREEIKEFENKVRISYATFGAAIFLLFLILFRLALRYIGIECLPCLQKCKIYLRLTVFVKQYINSQALTEIISVVGSLNAIFSYIVSARRTIIRGVELNTVIDEIFPCNRFAFVTYLALVVVGIYSSEMGFLFLATMGTIGLFIVCISTVITAYYSSINPLKCYELVEVFLCSSYRKLGRKINSSWNYQAATYINRIYKETKDLSLKPCFEIINCCNGKSIDVSRMQWEKMLCNLSFEDQAKLVNLFFQRISHVRAIADNKYNCTKKKFINVDVLLCGLVSFLRNTYSKSPKDKEYTNSMLELTNLIYQMVESKGINRSKDTDYSKIISVKKRLLFIFTSEIITEMSMLNIEYATELYKVWEHVRGIYMAENIKIKDVSDYLDKGREIFIDACGAWANYKVSAMLSFYTINNVKNMLAKD